MEEIETIRRALVLAAMVAQGHPHTGMTSAYDRIREAQSALEQLDKKLRTYQTEFTFPITTARDQL